MRRRHPAAMAGPAIAAMALVGCGDDPQLEEGTFPFKGTNTSSLGPLRDEMSRSAQEPSHRKKGAESGRPAATPEGATGSKPPAESEPRREPGPGSPPGRAKAGG
jgi:hypothetical protein